MTERLVTSNVDRRKHIATLHEMAVNFDAAAGGHEEGEEMVQAELWWRRAAAIRWALMYVQQHINLVAGEIRAIPEPEEAA